MTGQEELLTVSSERGVVPRRSANVTMFKAESYVGHKLCWPEDLVVNSLWAWARGLGVSSFHGIVSSAYGVYRIIPRSGIVARCLHELMRSVPYQWELQVRSKGVWISRLQVTDAAFLDAPILVPPPAEQAAIVLFLDHVDRRIRRYIRAKQKLIKLLEEQKQAIIHQAVTRGLDPNVRMKPSGVEWLGEVPEHWEVLRSSSVFSLMGGYAFPGSGFTRGDDDVSLPIVLTPINFDPRGGLRFGGRTTVRFSGTFPSKFVLRRGDLVTVLTDLSSKRLILGRVGFIDRDGILLNQRTARIDIRSSMKARIETRYLAYVLNSPFVRAATVATSRGSTVFHTSPNRMLAARWALPPVGEQREIVDQLLEGEQRHRAGNAAFDPARYRLEQNFDIGVKKLITTVPVRKPNRQEFVRVHPSQDYLAGCNARGLEQCEGMRCRADRSV